MASPPHRSTTNYSSLPNPRKRPSLPITSQPPNPKRRKHPSISAASTPATSHPLRQTSFPPEENQHSGARSASVESDATGVTGGRSVVTPGTGPKKRRRGRRKKRDGSVRDGSAKDGSVKEGSLKSGVKEGEGSVAGEEEEEEDDGDEGLEDDGERVDKVAEKKNLTVLVDAFNYEQNDRYDMFRRVKLKKETVRKITNQTLSQSVPPSIITTINGFTKVFIGHLIERARQIQPQLLSPPLLPSSLFPPLSPFPILELGAEADDDDDIFAPTAAAAAAAAAGSSIDTLSFGPDLDNVKTEPVPLLPGDLREAVRRQRRDGEGGGTGLGGVSVGLGVQGMAAARIGVGGKRLFM